ncbi:MAG: NifU family protein [Flavobacteriales bacterium]|jgi:Fe-S cluster biogenesis protein NfuA|tara:strand:+ start:2701 stop:3330 length:630 start_codon:yes stop_codon:yes gene_type:complete
MEKKIIPTDVYAEMTPNPVTMKFVTDRELISDGKQVDYTELEMVGESSPLAKELFHFPFVKGVFISANYVTVTKDESIGWELVVQQMRGYIRDWLMENEVAVSFVPESIAVKEDPADLTPEREAKLKDLENATPTELDVQIIQLLDEFVRPAVEQDGGAIDFRAFKDGKVYVELKGACNGCPSSMQTLKGGIEGLLKSKLEGVEEVVAV